MFFLVNWLNMAQMIAKSLVGDTMDQVTGKAETAFVDT